MFIKILMLKTDTITDINNTENSLERIDIILSKVDLHLRLNRLQNSLYIRFSLMLIFQ